MGATIVAAHAGDIISEFSVLMKADAGAKTLGGTIHHYPIKAEVNKKAVNLWRKAHFSQGTKNIQTQLFAWMRRGWGNGVDELLRSRSTASECFQSGSFSGMAADQLKKADLLSR
ncbi:MAG: hypothetical protein OEY77_15930 [Nitrospira sp.]|nr:hypothetical protein [Nitrospira sp.]